MRFTPMIAVTAAVALLWGGAGPWREPRDARAANQADRPPFDTSEWKTDFGAHSVPFTDILSGGPPKDGIPAIDQPTFDGVANADKWLHPKEPVILVERGGDARAYPLQILIWHEIVDDDPYLTSFLSSRGHMNQPAPHVVRPVLG